ncbi:MAG: alpha-amylase family glycosyl hydrolase [Bacteroidia bacterium]|nr:alpha-amylase family glycosyl hydrolase [Bacteroidia bacterium]
MRRFLLLILLGLMSGYLSAQIFPDSAWTQGYFHRTDTTWFTFDQAHYAVTPDRVTVTGAFRSWDQNMDDPAWKLTHVENGHWILAVPNAGYTIFGPQTEFKFRINHDTWLQPPAGTTNEKGGNLVLFPHLTPPSVKAELRRSGTIWVQFQGTERPLAPEAFRLTTASGDQLPIAQVLPNEERTALLIPELPLDIRRVYWLEIPALGLRSLCSFDGWFRDLYSTKPLGANISQDGSETVFRVFAPRAENIYLYLYHGKDDKESYQKVEMKNDGDGVWEAFFSENLQGVWYDFTVHGADDPGNHFFETTPVHISDPYARVSDDSFGKCRVWPATIPATPLKNGIPPAQDIIAYEVHIQDFTDLLPVTADKKGTIPAFYERGLKNARGAKVGFDYLVDLGINVVHLMPMQEFLHYPDEWWKPAFENDPFMIEQGIATENYQWGYRTSHCFAVESRYRQRGTEPGAERDQFRDLVQAFHDEDVAVIIDLVPNHTAENMDAEPYFFHWNVLDKQYYYRTNNLEHIGEYGNEVKTENRPMVQRWLIDQCKHWIEEFGVDGFRIDLAGQIDRQTLEKLREELGPDIIIYGEPWIGSFDPAFESNPSWDWYKHNSPIMFFQDDARNALKGPTSNPEEKGRDQGYAGGNFREKEKVKAAITSTFPDDKTPISGISYLDIHDNWALADQFAINDWNGNLGVDENRFKIAALLLYTSVGPIVTHGGTEMMRSKGHAELRETVKTMANGTKVYLHGKRDTYNMRKANQFVWEQTGAKKDGRKYQNNYGKMYAFWQGLNKFRMSEYGQAFRQADPIPYGYFEWLDTVNPYQLGYIVDGRILVLINTGGEAHDWTAVTLPTGNWRLIGNNDAFDHVNGVKDDKQWLRLEGGRPLDFELQGTEFKVWVKD